MEVDNINPSEINSNFSFHINEIQRITVTALNKKRKLQAEQLGLPMAKLKCSDGIFPSKSLSTLDENPEAEDLLTNIIRGGATNDGSEHESARDSNSFTEDSDFSMSVHGETAFQIENGKSWPSDRPSSSSFNWGSNSLKDRCYSLDIAAATEGDSRKEQFTSVGEEHHHSHHVGRLPLAENLDEHLTQFGSHDEYLYSGYGVANVEQFTEDIEEILNSNEENPNFYILSSGRSSINQESQRGKRRPTIDQEFEQYFSTLML